MESKSMSPVRYGIGWFFLLLGLHTAYAAPLTLKQAETAALSQSPEIKSLHAKHRGLKNASVAAGQLADPKLMVGTMNVPVDTFNFSQEPMTQIQIGLQQSFPHGRSLHYRSQQKNHLSIAESYKQKVIALQVKQGVRLSWLNLYYWLQSRGIIFKQRAVFKHLVKVTESLLANNKAQQKDAIRAQLELTELDNRLLEVNQNISMARAALGRWIGPTLAKEAAPTQLPVWPSPPSKKSFEAIIKRQPILKTDDALIAAKDAAVNWARQQYMPGFSVGVAYGFRQGSNLDGSGRADFLSARVNIDLPLLVHNRQDRTLKASHYDLLSSQENKWSDYRQLREAMGAQYAAWRDKRKSTSLYRSKLLPEAKQYAEATMTAYQNTQTDFPTLARAYVRELNTELAALKAAVARDRARVNLLYLQGN